MYYGSKLVLLTLMGGWWVAGFVLGVGLGIVASKKLWP